MYLNKEGYVWKLSKWLPQESTPLNRKKRNEISFCNLLTIKDFNLNKYLVTMDKTMITFKNYKYNHVYKLSQPRIAQQK
jgi:hypothetical protein